MSRYHGYDCSKRSVSIDIVKFRPTRSGKGNIFAKVLYRSIRVVQEEQGAYRNDQERCTS